MNNPLDAGLVVIDETSIVDVILASKLAKAVGPGAHGAYQPPGAPACSAATRCW